MQALEPVRPPISPTAPLRWDIWCRVIDNHGDLGVCWRLARELAGRGDAVRLWVDEPDALAWMAPHGCPGVELRPWRDDRIEADLAALPADALTAVGDVVVEAFGCDPPAAFVARMAARQPAPVWINLEYLSAEDYVERSHGLASPQWHGPGAGLTKHFFYPGFTPATGGLLREPELLDERDAFVAAQPVAVGGVRRALLFCYQNPALPDWLDLLARQPEPWCVRVTPGWAPPQVQAWQQLRSDATATTPALDWLPHVSQPEFDRLLWSSDLNLVRGEDSLVRALWAGRPFVWQLYPQDDGAHEAKLDAFLALYLDGAAAELAVPLRQAFRVWNGLAPAGEGVAAWTALLGPQWSAWRAWVAAHSRAWAAAPALVPQLLELVRRLAGRLE